mgnify:FL=1
MKSYTVHIDKITVSMLKMMASIRVKMMSSLVALVYMGRSRHMSMHMTNSVKLSEVARKWREHFCLKEFEAVVYFYCAYGWD